MNGPPKYGPERWKRMLQRQAALMGDIYEMLDRALKQNAELKARLKREVA